MNGKSECYSKYNARKYTLYYHWIMQNGKHLDSKIVMAYHHMIYIYTNRSSIKYSGILIYLSSY